MGTDDRDDRAPRLLESPTLTNELLALFETLVNVMFCVKDADGFYVEVNTAFVRRTGRASKREVIGQRAHDLFAEERAALYESRTVWSSPVRAHCEMSSNSFVGRTAGSVGI